MEHLVIGYDLLLQVFIACSKDQPVRVEIIIINKILKDELRQVNKHGKQASDERLYTEKKEGGRGLKNFKDVYKETRVRVACYLAIGDNEWLRKAWANEYDKEHNVH